MEERVLVPVAGAGGARHSAASAAWPRRRRWSASRRRRESKNLELKPYAVSSSTTDRAGAGAVRQRLDAQRRLRLQVRPDAQPDPRRHRRTDFAQVEEDLQQINLTRFSLFFPEKRDFFIEGQGIFDFGGVQAGNSPGDVPLLFFSRQIGLSQGQAVPVLGGARLTGRAGPFSIGALNIQTDDDAGGRRGRDQLLGAAPEAQHPPAQQRRRDGDPARPRPSHGGAAGRTTPATASAPTRRCCSSRASTSPATTPAPARRTRTAAPSTGASYRGRFDYTDDRYGAGRRAHAHRPRLHARGRLRAAHRRAPHASASCASARGRGAARVVRKLTWQGSLDYVTDAGGGHGAEPRGERRCSASTSSRAISCRSSTRASTSCCRRRSRSRPASSCRPAATPYDDHARSATPSASSASVSGRLSAATGTLYDGTQAEVDLQRPLGRRAAASRSSRA